MQIHELNNFTGTLGSGSFLAVDNGTDTGKLSTQQLLAATEARIDNIIAGPAPSAEEIVDARLGDDGVTYPSLGDAIRDQFSDVKSDLILMRTLSDAVNLSPWYQGWIRDDGTFGNSSEDCLSYYHSFESDADTLLNIKSGYALGIFEYATSSGTLVKMLGRNFTGTYELHAVEGHYYGFDIHKADSSALNVHDLPSDAVTVQYGRYTDETLSHSGKPADAKIVGDAIVTDVLQFADEKLLSYVNASGTIIDGVNWTSYKIPCNNLARLSKVSAFATSTDYNVVSFYDSDDAYISGVKFKSTDGTTPQVFTDIEIPSNASYLIISNRSASNPNLIAEAPQTALSFDRVTSLEEVVYQHDTISLDMRDNLFWDITKSPISATSYTGSYKASQAIEANEGDVFTLTITQGTSSKARAWMFVDKDYNLLLSSQLWSNNYTYTNETIKAPKDSAYLLLTAGASPYPTELAAVLRRNLASKEYVDDVVAPIRTDILNGKTVAVIGDSISTNGNTGTDANVPEITIQAEDVGIQLSAYLTYYDVQAGLSLGGHTFTSSEIGTEVTFVPTESDIGKSIGLPNNYNPNTSTVWWEVMQEELGNTTIPVCWSGSSVTSHEASADMRKTAHAWHTAQIRKCGIRTAGTMQRTAPDIVIIYRGVNDFSHSPYTLLTDGYFDNYDWQYPNDDTVTGGFGYKEGLCLTIKKLRDAYPNAQIYLCTMNVFKRVNYSHFPTNNGINSLPQYNNAIREVADFMGCGIIEFDKDGISFENCYSEGYITDDASIPTHPTDKGHKVMGNKAISDIKAQYNSMN